MHLDKGFVLHSRAYRDTSLLVDVLTKEQGRVCVLARGARRPKSLQKGLLQLFTPILLSYSGRSSLRTLGQLETNGPPFMLAPKAVLCGFYINELLQRLLAPFDPYSRLFEVYHNTLVALCERRSLPVALRLFEKELLQELGYALQLTQEADTAVPIISNSDYYYFPERGLVNLVGRDYPSQQLFSGRSLLAISRQDFSDVLVLRDAKRLMRLALNHLLDHKPLKSRALFLGSS